MATVYVATDEDLKSCTLYLHKKRISYLFQNIKINVEKCVFFSIICPYCQCTDI